ncbi:hypothetical protein PR002_g6194 [Phytophthora rubi]|nr:hypothetical protein PR002_g6194 [Phytophthora rubi]
MRNALVDFARVAAPLQARLQTALEGTKRTKHVAARVAIDFTAEERKSFGQVKQLLAKSATLVTPDDSDELILMTDASEAGWSIIVTAVEDWDPATSITKQQDQLVHCMSGTFKGAAQHWSVSEKEAFPIIKAATDLDYLLIRSKDFRLYSDHRNLIFIFAPGDEIKKHVGGKLQRWSLKLNELRYTIEHISGEDNVWADMASRWACIELPRETTTVKRWQTQDTHVQVELRPLRPDSEWPTEDDIKCAQLATTCTRPLHLEEQPNGLWRDEQNRWWIPEDAEVLLMRLMVIAHCGTSHRGVKVMINHLQEHFHIEKLETKARAFCSRCLLCCHVKGGKIIPRPWGETYRSNERNEALHMDYLFIGDYNGESNYLLVMKDDFSHYCELIECSSANAATAAMAILDWNSRYGMPQLLISDTATHFKNQLLEVLEELCHKTQMTQSFTLAYCPWINGSVERLNRDILQVLRVMLLEYNVEQDNWAALLPLIQANLNHSPVASLANHAPAEVFLGVKAKTPLQKILIGSDAIAANVVTTGDFSPGVREAVGNLRASLDGMHREVATAKEKQTKRNQSNQRGARSVNFHVGDYVLWSRVDAKKKGNKLSVTWVGPYRVIGANANSFEIEHLITATTKFVHASRLKM